MIESEYKMTVEGAVAELQKPQIEVVQVAPGFGFGEGSISFQERKDVVGEALLANVDAAIASADILTPVSTDKNGQRLDDDGCGDGRSVKRVFEGSIERSKSLTRSKIFGGGAAMTAAMEIGLGQGADSMNGLFSHSIASLKEKRIDFGAHTDDHAEGANSGCGAIDKAPAVVANVVKYQQQIVDTVTALGVDTTGLDQVIDNFVTYSDRIQGQHYSGRQVVEEIIDSGKVVKELQSEHREIKVLINEVEGYTVDQELIRSVSDDQAQVFGVDIWRLQELAMRKYPEDQALQNQAFLSELVYTLGVSATLTRGDLPVVLLRQTSPVLAS